ncbi:MAG: MauE/DoxX family redox-associated membrane protein, partial [Bacteroidota bacterium]
EKHKNIIKIEKESQYLNSRQMTQTYELQGMTCNGCKATVERNLSQIDQVLEVRVSLENQEAEIDTLEPISTDVLRKALPNKYQLSEKNSQSLTITESADSPSKLQQLKPLLLILSYIAMASVLLHYQKWDGQAVMLDFMGLFYIVFSFFKLLDLKGFPSSFSMYDPLAKRVPAYAQLYPFIETALGLLFLLRFQIPLALIGTIIILGITTYGVLQTLLSKKSIQCACLGTALKLPMTEATLIENTIMLVMATTLLFNL